MLRGTYGRHRFRLEPHGRTHALHITLRYIWQDQRMLALRPYGKDQDMQGNDW